MSRQIEAKTENKQAFNKVKNYLDSAGNIGKKNTKITQEMLIAGWYLRDKGATWLNIKEFFSKEYEIDVGESGIKQRFYKNKDMKEQIFAVDSEQEVSQMKPVDTPENTKPLPLKQENDEPVTTMPKAKETAKEEITDTIVYDEDGAVVLKSKRYKRKDAVYDSGDAGIEEEIDKLEYEINRGNEINLKKVGKNLWDNYVCRYESVAEVRDCVKKRAPLKDVPSEARGRFSKYTMSPSREYCHLEELK